MISVVVPVYNVFDYLYDCVQSIVTQTFTDWEIILVDDGSTDGSERMADTLAAQDDRIRVVHQPNGGLSAARNTGISLARGSQICFVDSDDAVAPRYLETLASLADEKEGAIACVGHADFSKSLPIPPDTPPAKWPVRRYTPAAAIEAALYQQGVDHSAWGKLYPRHLFDSELFTPGILYEDLDIFYRLFEHASGVIVSDAPLYYYRRGRSGSILTDFSERRADVLDVILRMEEHFRRTNPRMLRSARDRRLNAAFNIMHLITRSGQAKHHIATVERCRHYIRDIRLESLTDPRVRIKTKAGIIMNFVGLDRMLYRLLPTP